MAPPTACASWPRRPGRGRCATICWPTSPRGRCCASPPPPFAGVEAGALRGLRIGAEDLAALAQGMLVHYGAPASDAAPAIAPSPDSGEAEIDEPAEEQIGTAVEAASVSTGDAAAPPS